MSRRGPIHFPRRYLFSGSHSGSAPEITPEEAERQNAKGGYLIWGFWTLFFSFWGIIYVSGLFYDKVENATNDFMLGTLGLMIAYGICYKKLKNYREKMQPKH